MKIEEEKLRDILLSYESYCEKMKNIYENPRPKGLLIDAFIAESIKKEEENYCHYSGLPSPDSYDNEI
jgi:hypothetical protein